MLNQCCFTKCSSLGFRGTGGARWIWCLLGNSGVKQLEPRVPSGNVIEPRPLTACVAVDRGIADGSTIGKVKLGSRMCASRAN